MGAKCATILLFGRPGDQNRLTKERVTKTEKQVNILVEPQFRVGSPAVSSRVPPPTDPGSRQPHGEDNRRGRTHLTRLVTPKGSADFKVIL